MACCGEHVSLTVDLVGQAVNRWLLMPLMVISDAQSLKQPNLQWQLCKIQSHFAQAVCYLLQVPASSLPAVEGLRLCMVLNLCLRGAAAKLVPVGFGIRKMQITAVIEDAKVESMDSIIEEEIVRDGESEYIQSIDVVSFNKL